jgi:succinate-semialdehyde dehydrogenase/glutarate-semialdehyde dehydrogenase
MVITMEETFGPVAPLYRFKSDAEAIKMANDVEFGLAAATSAASGASPRPSNTASSASMRASSRQIAGEIGPFRR